MPDIICFPFNLKSLTQRCPEQCSDLNCRCPRQRTTLSQGEMPKGATIVGYCVKGKYRVKINQAPRPCPEMIKKKCLRITNKKKENLDNDVHCLKSWSFSVVNNLVLNRHWERLRNLLLIFCD